MRAVPGLLIAAFVAGCSPMLGGSGLVIEMFSERPIGGAHVMLECRQSAGHGSVSVAELFTDSDAQGHYSFSTWSLLRCSSAFVGASKNGYVAADGIHPGYSYTDFRRVPAVRYLVKLEDVTMLRLIAITPSRSGNVTDTHGNYLPRADYMTWYGGFQQASRIAQTERERAFVLERYCETLFNLYALLSENDKAELAKSTASFQWRGASASGRYDQNEVAAYCTKLP